MKISNKFEVTTVYTQGVYFIPTEIIETTKEGFDFEIQGLYYDRYRCKWYQDSFYKDRLFIDSILNLFKSNCGLNLKL